MPVALSLLYRPDILKEDIKVFYVKYNDPIYVKLEKLDIMIRLANPSNIANVLAELKEYVLKLNTMVSHDLLSYSLLQVFH